MRPVLRSLRTRFAVLGFLAGYVPVLLLFGVVVVSDVETEAAGGGLVTSTSGHRSAWVTWAVLALAPVAAALAWVLAGRAVRDIDRVRAVAEDVEAADLTRRVGLDRGPSEVVRLAASIDDMLADARGRARTIARRPADLMAVVRTVAEEVGVLAATKAIDLSVTGPEAAECAFDEPTVRRAVTNLVDNAVRYAPAGSTVEISVAATAYEVAVVVTDHGAGIPAAEQEGVFRRFWRSRTDVAGTGLGLPIAHQVALAHGGELTLVSPGPAGDGCAFRLTLRR
jgi:signal transduction histidine kinase